VRQLVKQAIPNIRELVCQRPSETDRLGWLRRLLLPRWWRWHRRRRETRRRVLRWFVRLLWERVLEPAEEILTRRATWWHCTRHLRGLRGLRRAGTTERTRYGARPSRRWWWFLRFLQSVLLFPFLVLPVLVFGRCRDRRGLWWSGGFSLCRV